jgi:4-hydroxyphenylpyruvate dioxygenase-like putative hemolysin
MTDLWENPAGTDGFEFIELDQMRRGVLKPVL